MVVDILQQFANLLLILFIVRWAQLKLDGSNMGTALAYLFH